MLGSACSPDNNSFSVVFDRMRFFCWFFFFASHISHVVSSAHNRLKTAERTRISVESLVLHGSPNCSTDWRTCISLFIFFSLCLSLRVFIYTFAQQQRPRHVFIHRDIKPANVFIDGQGHVRIGDMGLAVVLIHSHVETATSCCFAFLCLIILLQEYMRHTTPIGTIEYIEPEYRDTGVLVCEADVYSAGLTALAVLFNIVPRFMPEIRDDYRQNPSSVVSDILRQMPNANWQEQTVMALLDLCLWFEMLFSAMLPRFFS